MSSNKQSRKRKNRYGYIFQKYNGKYTVCSTENSDHVAKIFNFLNSSPVFSLIDFKGLLEEIRNDGNVTGILSDVNPELVTNQQKDISNQRVIQKPQECPPQPNPNIRIEPNWCVENVSPIQNDGMSTCRIAIFARIKVRISSFR